MRSRHLRALGLAAGLVVTSAIGFAHSSIGTLLSAIDPEGDPAVRYLNGRAQPALPAWHEHLRWSADAGLAYAYDGTASIAASGTLALPLAAFTEEGARKERASVAAELARLERDAIARDLVFGVLDASCRWGYLRAIEPVLSQWVADADADAALWRARHTSVLDEAAALVARIRVAAPAIAPAVTGDERGFLCFPPDPPPEPMDGLDRHPSLRRLALEAAQDAHHADLVGSVGGPELAAAGSVHHALGTSRIDVTVRLTARIPFGLPGAHGSATAEADLDTARIHVRLDGDSTPERSSPGADLEHRLLQERAALQYRLAVATAEREAIRVQARRAWAQAADAGLVPRWDACRSLCLLAPRGPLPPHARDKYLQALGLAHELARATFELMRVRALDPAALAEPRPLAAEPRRATIWDRRQ